MYKADSFFPPFGEIKGGLERFAFFSIGSNLGDRMEHLRFACKRMQEQIGVICSISSVYETQPWGFVSANAFLNIALCIDTPLESHAIVQQTQLIEQEAGRIASAGKNYIDRVLDIDIVMHGQQIITDEQLTLPHPRMDTRKFVLIPLNEIAPQLVHPILHKTIEELLMTCNDTGWVNLFKKKSLVVDN